MATIPWNAEGANTGGTVDLIVSKPLGWRVSPAEGPNEPPSPVKKFSSGPVSHIVAGVMFTAAVPANCGVVREMSKVPAAALVCSTVNSNSGGSPPPGYPPISSSLAAAAFLVGGVK